MNGKAGIEIESAFFYLVDDDFSCCVGNLSMSNKRVSEKERLKLLIILHRAFPTVYQVI